jgi:hypothetical protein
MNLTLTLLAALLALANVLQLLPWVKEWLNKSRLAKFRPWFSPVLGAVAALLLAIGLRGALSKAIAVAVVAVAVVVLVPLVSAATQKRSPEERTGMTATDAIMLFLMSIVVALAGRAAIRKGGDSGWEVLDEIGQQQQDAVVRKVTLNVYETRHMSFLPIYHSEVVVGEGDAYSFWGGLPEDAGILGPHEPGYVPDAFKRVPLRSFLLGYTTKTDADIRIVIERLHTEGFVAKGYDTIRRNCNHFSQAFVNALGINVTIPTNVNQVARVISTVVPKAEAPPMVTEKDRLLMRIRDDIRNLERRRDMVSKRIEEGRRYISTRDPEEERRDFLLKRAHQNKSEALWNLHFELKNDELSIDEARSDYEALVGQQRET